MPPDGRASLRHDKVLDGIDALPDENTQARQHRDGAARPGLQHETGDAHSERWRIDGSDPRVRKAPRTWSHRPTISVRVLHNLGQTRHFDRAPTTSGLPRQADNFRAGWHVSKVPILLQKALPLN